MMISFWLTGISHPAPADHMKPESSEYPDAVQTYQLQ